MFCMRIFHALECVSSGTIRKFEQILCQFKEETRRLSSAKSRVDDAEMAQRRPKLRIKEFLRYTLICLFTFVHNQKRADRKCTGIPVNAFYVHASLLLDSIGGNSSSLNPSPSHDT